jgi:hypothetical protein
VLFENKSSYNRTHQLFRPASGRRLMIDKALQHIIAARRRDAIETTRATGRFSGGLGPDETGARENAPKTPTT